FLFLETRVSSHAFPGKAVRQLKHAVVQRVETRQRYELELVTHSCQFALELRDGGIIQLALPVERRRAVISQHLPGELGADAFGKDPRLFQIGLSSLAPEHVN